MLILSAATSMHPVLEEVPLTTNVSVLKYIAPFSFVVDPPLIWSWQFPRGEHPARSPNMMTPAKEPLLGAVSVTFAWPLIVIGA
jgi:hypothetical protein